MLTCVLCQTNTMFWNYLCEDCTKIQILMKVYDPETIHTLIDKTLRIQSDKMPQRVKKNIGDLYERKEK